jgi:hypothetical protein
MLRRAPIGLNSVQSPSGQNMARQHPDGFCTPHCFDVSHGIGRCSKEDITNMDTPTVVAYDSNVKLFFSNIIFNTCDEWTLHHDMCSTSITEVLTWIKEGLDHAWKGWIMKHLDWGPNTSAPYASTRSPRYLCYKETRRPNLIRFGKVDSDSRNSPHQNNHRDHIRTPFWTFFMCMER